MTYESKEMVRRRLRRMGEEARGVGDTVTRTGSTRQAEMLISNLNFLPVRIVPPGRAPAGADAATSPATKPVQSGGKALYLEGYSAPPGSAAAAPDGTGRGGDVAMLLRGASQGTSRGTGAPAVLSPKAAGAIGAAVGYATIVLQIPLAAVGQGVSRGLAIEAEGSTVNRLGIATGVGRGAALAAVRWAQGASGTGVGVGAATLTVLDGSAGTGTGSSRGIAGIVVKRTAAGAATGASRGSATILGAGSTISLGGAARAASFSRPTLSVPLSSAGTP